MTGNASEKQSPPDRGSTTAVVVTYFPSGDLVSRLRAVQAQVGQVVIVDNATSGEAAERLRAAESELRVSIIWNRRNLGIAAALNQGVQWAQEQECQWILTLDQDTVVADNFIETISVVYGAFSDKEKLAVIGANYVDPVRCTQFAGTEGGRGCAWHEEKTVITSGSMIPLSAYLKIGPFREEFFLDCVDFDFCLRARSMGYHVIMTRDAVMHHPIGEVSLHRLPWKMTGTSNHSAIRRYYMTRNQLVLARKYLWSEPGWTLSTLYRHLKTTILMSMFEKDIALKLKYTWFGLLDGLKSNFGRILA